MKQLLIDGLAFEVTRKCNQQCQFCMRGKSQNIDIDYDVIDKFFFSDNYKITDINYLSFSGGEPLLNPEAIEYIINLIIENDIYVNRFSMVTNGLIYEPRVIKAIDRLNKKMNILGYEQLEYIPDQFHKPMPPEIRSKYLKGEHLYFGKYNELSEEDICSIGLAKENGIAGTIEEPDYTKPIFYQEVGDKVLFYPGRERVRHQEGFIRRKIQDIYINALGYVLSTGDGEYKMMDQYNLGNIKDKGIISISTNVKTYQKVKRSVI